MKGSEGFVVLADQVQHMVQEIRYHSAYNFIGDRIDGYELPVALLTREAARAFREAANEFYTMGYVPKVFDAYRPARAVKQFVQWGIEDQDIRMKQVFYPDLEKQDLFIKGYIAKQSGHSRGSTVDLTLIELNSGKEADMGSPFDFFGEISHPDYVNLTSEQTENRMLLRRVMIRCGFRPLDCEWWHFTLEDEPYPDTYFDFPIGRELMQ